MLRRFTVMSRAGYWFPHRAITETPLFTTAVKLEPPERFELPTRCLQGSRSGQLSYKGCIWLRTEVSNLAPSG